MMIKRKKKKTTSKLKATKTILSFVDNSSEFQSCQLKKLEHFAWNVNDKANKEDWNKKKFNLKQFQN